MTAHEFNSPGEYERVLAAARAAGVAVQEVGGWTLVIPDQWDPPRPPRAPKAAKAGTGDPDAALLGVAEELPVKAGGDDEK